jgi:hypothetical protein
VKGSSIELVGHKRESIYRRYAMADESMLKEAADKLALFHATNRQFKGPQGNKQELTNV